MTEIMRKIYGCKIKIFVNYDLLFKFGDALKAELSKAHTIRVQSKEGTSLEMKMSLNPVQTLFRKVKRRLPGGYGQTSGTVFPQAGRISEQDNISFPGGQLAFNGIRDTIEGTVVIDGYMRPPEEIGPVKEPIIIRIRKGEVVDIDNTSHEGKLLAKWLKGKSKNVMHFCLGFNPGAKWSGKVMEVERVFGSLSIGITPYPHHTDGIMKNPAIYLDEKVFLKDGKFENGELSELQRRLLMAKK